MSRPGTQIYLAANNFNPLECQFISRQANKQTSQTKLICVTK